MGRNLRVELRTGRNFTESGKILIARFKRACVDNDIFDEIKKRRYFESNGQKARRKLKEQSGRARHAKKHIDVSSSFESEETNSY